MYICESMFDEARQQIVDLPKDGLKKFVHSSAVYQDEIYFFRRLINPTKVHVTNNLRDLSRCKNQVDTDWTFTNVNAVLPQVLLYLLVFEIIFCIIFSLFLGNICTFLVVLRDFFFFFF